MSFDMANTDQLNEFRRDAQRLGIDVVPPSVATSYRLFETGENRIFYALAALKGVGEAAVDHIVELRNERPFASLEDFCARVDPRLVGRRVLEALINAGALDCFGYERAAMAAGLERMVGLAQRRAEEAASGQADMFGAGAGAVASAAALVLPAAEPWLPAEKLHREFLAAGFYLSAHPLDEYASALARMRVQNWAEFSVAVKRGATAGRLAGTIIARQERKTRTGNRMGIVTLSDASGQFEAVLFAEGLAQYRDALEPGRAVVVTVSAEDRPEGINLRIQTVQALEEEAARTQRAMRVFLRDQGPIRSLATHLKAKGEGDVSLIFIKDNGAREIEVALPGGYRISPQIGAALKAVPGVVDVEMV
jgi:DNA polymerase-3 subunit alpha